MTVLELLSRNGWVKRQDKLTRATDPMVIAAFLLSNISVSPNEVGKYADMRLDRCWLARFTGDPMPVELFLQWMSITNNELSGGKMVIAKLSHQQVIGSLRATGSTDQAVLFARKEELLSETKRLKILGIVPIVLGVILSISIIGAIVGIPMIIFGVLVRKEYSHNLKVAEEGFVEYLNSIYIAPAI